MTKHNPNSESMFSAVVRDYARRKHENQYNFADHIGVRQTEVSSWITGKSLPTGSTLENIAVDMGIAPETLQLLSSVSVADAMKIVLEELDQED